ncbi:unnamed protein product [Durusdinium trenchii]|uniref:Inorganic phosphate transporter 1-6 (OsPT6) (OsPht1) n=2 Tax=Durusdinium trenchii TaxID=1381693 RepID=A0ABP0MHF9_9DINO
MVGRRKESNFIPSVGNFSVQYNFNSASAAASILSDPQYLGYPLHVEPQWSKDFTPAAVFVGAMLGMLGMGRLGDTLGRTRAMQVTLSFTVLGAVIPALAFGSSGSIYGTVLLGRLLLGVGVGGIYPLSAVSSAEGCEDASEKGKHVAQAFFFQSVGVLAPYLVAMLLLTVISSPSPAPWVPELQFRLLFALGAAPALLVLVASFSAHDSEEFAAEQHRGRSRRGFDHQVVKTLIGTAGCWFLYDLAFYGTTIFTPTILERLCITGDRLPSGHCEQTLLQTSRQSALISAMGIPGSLLAVLVADRLGCKRLNSYGFILLSVSFALLALAWHLAPDAHAWHFVLFCLVTLLLNWGPNLGTYVLPALCFPAAIRSTCHGLSSTGGKVGAVVGTLIFDPISESSMGIPGVLWIQCVTCVLGAVVSMAMLKHDWEYEVSESRSLRVSLPTTLEVTWPVLVD